jgi:hypothetical protein
MGGPCWRLTRFTNIIKIVSLTLNNTDEDQNMTSLFDQNRNYVLGDAELELIGDRDKLAQWRHKGLGPAFYRLGRKIIYRGADLNIWAEANRVEPGAGGHS